ncbi:uncharacterized membrane protein YkoI [Rhizobium subbaraonis]|uniref:Uncharacterized membrane protein YkoI n=1 Tax=Rhizobium subbaraonis TaxID=908946 RepID=A0A285U7E0_9HYPH|nr:PepSY domain-containing protein [Rhizobium subbaraonis]SOC37643.1 uncharacterized membrane protein YkoI [Rhizobium subbaraonis]
MTQKTHVKRLGLRLLAACAVLYPAMALSEASPPDVDDVDDTREHYEAREALRKGEVLPLDRIIEVVRKQFQGDIIEIEFERNDGKYVYEIEIIDPSGRVVEVEVDAKTAEILDGEDDD